MPNRSFTAYAFSADTGTGTVTSGDLDNSSGRSAIVVIDIVTITGTGTPSLAVTLQGKDPASGKYYTILTSATLTSAATTILRVDANITAAANTIAQDVMPSVFRLSLVKGGSTVTNLTATVGVQLIG